MPSSSQEPQETLASEIEEAAGADPILCVVIGNHESYSSPDHDLKGPFPAASWEQARPRLDYDYDRGYGGQSCHNVYAWTANRVIFIHEYDGSTGVHWVPRNPVECEPSADGFYA